MYPETLPQKTARLLNKIKDSQFLQPFYLTGGTALALQLGHRESEDLDFFSNKHFDPLLLQEDIEKLDKLKDVQVDKGTLNLYLLGVQLQFLYYPYPLLEPFIKWQGISLSSVVDIACTKLQTIASRGGKKDFIDLYLILKEYSLNTLFTALKKKYQGIDYDLPHILKSLVYFEDANFQPMPRMHAVFSWEKVKKEITRTVKAFKF